MFYFQDFLYLPFIASTSSCSILILLIYLDFLPTLWWIESKNQLRKRKWKIIKEGENSIVLDLYHCWHYDDIYLDIFVFNQISTSISWPPDITQKWFSTQNRYMYLRFKLTWFQFKGILLAWVIKEVLNNTLRCIFLRHPECYFVVCKSYYVVCDSYCIVYALLYVV